ncbi:MAG TPA: ParB/RepB/Spo0J family partition protein, partial [Thermomicrobiales bacterium]|nr:ParB/RepB/Spo0J family partition protein [Thermomicrobiales bacterium]
GDGRLTGAMQAPIERVAPDPRQPRRDLQTPEAEARLAELAASIREFGILQPLVVREGELLPDGTQQFVIIAGGRRRAAAEQAGLSHVPVLVRDEDGPRVRVLQLIENLQREDLNPIDEALAFQELMELEGLSTVQLAARLHITEQTVRDRLRLLTDQVFADAVRRRQVPASAVRELLKLPHDVVQDFRRRVEGGERLQVNDILAARLELQAAGRANPLRMGGRRKASPKDEATGRDDEAAQPGGADQPSGAVQTAEMRAEAPHPAPEAASPPTADSPRPAAATSRPTPPHGPRPTAHADTRHPAATAAWAERLADLWLQWLRAQAPAVAGDLEAAIREGAPGEVPDWWAAVYEGIRRRLDEPDRPA